MSEESEGEEVSDFHEKDTVNYKPLEGSSHQPFHDVMITEGPFKGSQVSGAKFPDEDYWRVKFVGWVPERCLTLVKCPHKKPKTKKVKHTPEQIAEMVRRATAGHVPGHVIELYKTLQDEGVIGDLEFEFLRILSTSGEPNMTSNEVAAVYAKTGKVVAGETPVSCMSPRPAQLEPKGLIVFAGKRYCKVGTSRGKVDSWSIAPPGTVPETIKRDEREDLFKLIARAHTVIENSGSDQVLTDDLLKAIETEAKHKARRKNH